MNKYIIKISRDCDEKDLYYSFEGTHAEAAKFAVWIAEFNSYTIDTLEKFFDKLTPGVKKHENN